MSRLLLSLPLGVLGLAVGCRDLPDPGLPVDTDTPEDSCEASAWYLDGDGDTWGGGEAVMACEAPEGHVARGGDCDDSSSFFHPGAREDDCTDPNDYNCDGSVMFEDGDGDGWGACEDCDDSDASVSPRADEICDGIDNDCDGTVDDGAIDGTDWFYDADGDGFGGTTSAQACEAPAGFVADDGDCDDLDRTSFPGAVEICDSADNDCDGLADEDEAMDVAVWFIDRDHDGHGDPEGASVSSCEPPEGYAKVADDCDDSDSLVSPMALEYCDGETDEDCDGTVDEDGAADVVFWYPDEDGDGFGCDGCGQLSCEQPDGFADNPLDCDDGEATTFPGAEELCDEVDNDCDLAIDETAGAVFYPDLDGDGYGDEGAATWSCEDPGSGWVDDGGDCDDGESEVHPGAAEQCNGVDDDCDGLDVSETDGDGDGVLTCAAALWVHTDHGSNSRPEELGRFRSSDAAALMTEHGLSWESVELRDIELTEGLLSNYAVVVIYGKGTDGPLSDEETDALDAWLADGGGLLYHGWHPTKPACDMVDSLPEEVGLGCAYEGRKIDGIGQVVMSHPVTAGVEAVKFLGGEIWTAEGTADVLVETSDGEPVVLANEVGLGRVVMLADEWPLYNEGTRTTHDISAADNRQLVDNIWCWLSSDDCDFEEDDSDTGESAVAPDPTGLTPEDPGASCFEILQVYPESADGWYYLERESGLLFETWCDMDGGGWTLLYEDEFEHGVGADWSDPTTSECGDFGTLLGGYGLTAGTELSVTLDADIAHSETHILAELAALDSWDGETLYLSVDGYSRWDTNLNNHASTGDEVCGWSRRTNPFFDQLLEVDETAPHLGDSLTLAVGSTLDQGPTDESFGIDSVEVWIR